MEGRRAYQRRYKKAKSSSAIVRNQLMTSKPENPIIVSAYCRKPEVNIRRNK